MAGPNPQSTSLQAYHWQCVWRAVTKVYEKTDTGILRERQWGETAALLLHPHWENIEKFKIAMNGVQNPLQKKEKIIDSEISYNLHL